LEKLIDTKNPSGRTALLLACQKKDYATIELLVEAGADVNTVDKEGNTAIIHAISSLEEDTAPKKELSPSISKVLLQIPSFLVFLSFNFNLLLNSVLAEC